MAKLSIRKGDTVKVISGDEKGKTGTVTQILVDANKAIVENLNKVKRHIKPTATNPQGSIVEKEAPIHISNLMVVDSKGQASKIGRKLDKDGNLVRFSKKSGEILNNK